MAQELTLQSVADMIVDNKRELVDVMVGYKKDTDQKFIDLTEIMIKSFDRVYSEISEVKRELYSTESRLGERISRVEFYTRL